MSKRLQAEICCPHCDRSFDASLYRTVWIEFPEYRDLIFNDEINAVVCPHCSTKTKLEFPFLCTNVRRGIAVWYEPYPDEAIDRDVELYKAHMGADSFYARAPRIRDWKAFKQKIVELEATKSPVERRASLSPAAKRSMRGFIESLRRHLR